VYLEDRPLAATENVSDVRIVVVLDDDGVLLDLVRSIFVELLKVGREDETRVDLDDAVVNLGWLECFVRELGEKVALEDVRA
jgi:hypothetical protein